MSLTTETAVAPYRSDEEVIAAEQQAVTIADQARALKVVDEASNAAALNMLSACRKAVKKIDGLKKRWLDPLNAQVKLIRSDFDEMASAAREADKILTAKTTDYRTAVQEKARKEQARLNALAAKRQEKAAKRAAEKGEDAPPVVPITPTVIGPAKTVETDDGKVTYRKVIRGEVIDADAIPREWCCPDEKKLGAAARAGIITPENCPAGYRITITEEPVVR